MFLKNKFFCLNEEVVKDGWKTVEQPSDAHDIAATELTNNPLLEVVYIAKVIQVVRRRPVETPIRVEQVE